MHFVPPALRKALTGAAAALAAGGLLGTSSALASSLALSSGALTYTATAAEANHVTFSFDLRHGVFVIHDSGVESIEVPQSAKGCNAYTPQIAYCEFLRVTSITARVGDGGSFAESKLSATPVTLHAGAGDDTLIGGGGADTLIAAAGADRLTAGSGDTRLVGGTGTTVMTGGSGHNSYQGGSGADAINARNGVAEGVSCAAGTDSVTADPGDSTAADCETVDRNSTGTTPTPDAGGTAVAPAIDPALPVFDPPEPAISTAPVALTAANRVPVRIGCPSTVAGGCRGSISLALAGRTADHGKLSAARRAKGRRFSRTRRFRIAAGNKAVVPVVLSRRGGRYVRRRLRRGRRVGLAVTVLMRSEAGTQRVTSTITVRGARRPGRRR